VDLVLVNAKVVTVDPNNTQAEAVAIRGNTFAAVGTTAAIRKMAGPQIKIARSIESRHGYVTIRAALNAHAFHMCPYELCEDSPVRKSTTRTMRCASVRRLVDPWTAHFASLKRFTADFMRDRRRQPPMQECC
jgi:hypothetical protein